MEGVDEPDDAGVGGYEDGLAVAAELEPGPVALLLLGQLEGGEWALVEAAQVVQLDALRVDAGGKDEALGVVRRDGPARDVHHTVAVGRAQVPEAEGLVQRAREERVLDGADAEGHDLLRVAREVAYVPNASITRDYSELSALSLDLVRWNRVEKSGTF